MASKAGVWIDHKQAIVILITDTGPEIKKFDSVIKQPVQPVISSRSESEFNKHITSKKLRGVTVELETSFKMSDRQIAAKVGEHFAEAPVSKSVAPKKTAKGMSGKRTKKTGK